MTDATLGASTTAARQPPEPAHAPSLPASAPSAHEILIQPGSGLTRLGLPQVWEYRHLLAFFVLRSLRARYRPTVFGLGWLVIQPALLAGVYWCVFGLVLGVKSDRLPFLVFVFSGVGTYLFFNHAISQTAKSLTSSLGTFSKVYYPRLIAPLTTLLSACLELLAALAILLVLMLIFGVAPGWAALASPLFLAGLVLLALAAGLNLAALSVHHRDVQIALPVVMRALVFASPVTYPATLIPETWRGLYYLNPFTVFLQGFRWTLLDDTAPPLWSIGWAVAVVVGLMLSGLLLFNRVESSLVDSL